MILQALHEYYERSEELAPPGWERKRIPYLIEIDRDGRFVQLTSLRTGTRPTDVSASLVPKAEGRSGSKAYANPNLLWDHVGYVLGHPKSAKPADIELAAKQHTHFRQRIDALAAQLSDSPGLAALKRFYDAGEQLRVASDPHWPECAGITGCNVTFRLAGETDLLVHDPRVRGVVDEGATDDAAVGAADIQIECLVTGEPDRLQRKHFPVSGVGSKPAALAAINDDSLPAFASRGKHQGENFPVGRRAAFAYATSLDHLLRPNSPQKLRIADTTVVFWAQRADPIEDALALLIGSAVDDLDARVQQVRALYESIRSGAFDGARGQNRFYVLGLTQPNVARLAVRFWRAETLRELGLRIRRWFDDLALARPRNEGDEYPNLDRLLRSLVLDGELKRLPPALSGDVLHAVFDGTPLPAAWLTLAVQRCRTEQGVPYHRAACIKAAINRSIRRSHSSEEVYQPMLDPANTRPAYRLGRLFAVLEKIQEESAGGGLNKTIRDRYYGALSSSPATVLPLLLKLKNHHVAKLDDRGYRVLYRAFQDHRPDDYIGEVLDAVDEIPAHLTLPEQGRFALGYYHQRHAFFSKADENVQSAQREGSA